MALTRLERERITDSRLKLRSAAHHSTTSTLKKYRTSTKSRIAWTTRIRVLQARSSRRKKTGSNEAGRFRRGKLPMMDTNFDAMMIAVRVLAAVNEKRPPNPADLGYLRQFAPLSVHLPADELACEVMQQAIRRRTEEREAGTSAGAL